MGVLFFCLIGEVPEWPNGAVSKTAVRVTVPRVRIPPSPPLVAEALTKVGTVRISFFILFYLLREEILPIWPNLNYCAIIKSSAEFLFIKPAKVFLIHNLFTFSI